MAKTVNIQEVDKPPSAAAAIAVVLQGFTVGSSIELTLWEDDTQDSLIADPKSKTIQKIGSIAGEVIALDVATNRPPLLSLKPTSHKKDAKSSLRLIVALPQPGGAAAVNIDLNLPLGKADVFEGDTWEVFATVEGHDVVSPTTRVARVRRALSVQKGEATYSHYVGNIIRFFRDGSDDATGSGGYFHDLEVFIREAVDFIFIADWSFHPHTRAGRSGSYDLASTVGAALIKRARKEPSMVIAVHTWDHTNIGAPDPQNDDGADEIDRIAKQEFGLSRRPDNLLWRKSSRTGFGYSHHQKFVVMDAAHQEGKRRLRGFLGGLDVTKGRFDWREHPILPKDSRSAGFIETPAYVRAGAHVYDDWYNAEFYDLGAVKKPPTLPRQPWHDIALHIVGPTCWDIVREFVARWRLDPSLYPAIGDTNSEAKKTVTDKYVDVLTRLKVPGKPHNPVSNPQVYVQQWHPAGGIWAAQLLRSMKREHVEATPPLTIRFPDRTRQEFRWSVNGNAERSIMLAYLQAIRQAESYVYIETQYFISSGSMWSRPHVANPVALALAQRAIDLAKKDKPFHIYLVVPMFPEGAPGSGANCAQRQFQWNTISAMATMMEKQTGKPHATLMSVFFVANWEDLGGKAPNVAGDRESNVRANRRYQIYVHSKFMLVDDRYMIVGSANLNERSLAGDRDSEIGVQIWPSDDSTLKECIDQARKFRLAIWSEHLGPKFPPASAGDPGSAACVNAVRDAAAENYAAFREGRRDPAVHGALCLWPLQVTDGQPPVGAVSKAPELDGMIPDRPFGLKGSDADAWRWHAPGKWYGKVTAGGVVKIKEFTASDDETAE